MAFNLFKKKDEKKEEPAKPEASVPAEQKREEVKPEEAVAAPVTGVSVLKHMHISEKAAMGEAMNQYTFIVTPSATKNEIAKEVQSRYKVDVTAVNIIRLRGKKRRLGRFTGSTNSKKKAIVTLEKGQRIASA